MGGMGIKKIEMNLIGGGFQHANSSTAGKIPKNIIWLKQSNKSAISFFVDNAVLSSINQKTNKKKFAWISESNAIRPLQEKIIKHKDQILETYELIFTHNKKLLQLDNKFKFCPADGWWIKNPQIFKKINLISMISSNKNRCVGHQIRLDYVKKYQKNVDLFGRGFNEIKNKEEGLKNYMFSIAIENASYDFYFTEKIMDCFATGTIPIYLGCQNIGEYFNVDGIIFLDSNFKISSLSSDLYYENMSAIVENFEIVKKWEVPEDWIFEKYLINYM